MGPRRWAALSSTTAPCTPAALLAPADVHQQELRVYQTRDGALVPGTHDHVPTRDATRLTIFSVALVQCHNIIQ